MTPGALGFHRIGTGRPTSGLPARRTVKAMGAVYAISSSLVVLLIIYALYKFGEPERPR